MLLHLRGMGGDPDGDPDPCWAKAHALKFPSGLPADYQALDSGYVGAARPPVPPGWKLVSTRQGLGGSPACRASSKTSSWVMLSFMQIMSQYLGPQEAQLYSELQAKAKHVVKLSEETKNKLEAETGDRKLAAAIVRNLRDYIKQ